MEDRKKIKKKGFLENPRITLIRNIIFWVLALGAFIYLIITYIDKKPDIIPLIMVILSGLVIFPEFIMEIIKYIKRDKLL